MDLAVVFATHITPVAVTVTALFRCRRVRSRYDDGAPQQQQQLGSFRAGVGHRDPYEIDRQPTVVGIMSGVCDGERRPSVCCPFAGKRRDFIL